MSLPHPARPWTSTLHLRCNSPHGSPLRLLVSRQRLLRLLPPRPPGARLPGTDVSQVGIVLINRSPSSFPLIAADNSANRRTATQQGARQPPHAKLRNAVSSSAANASMEPCRSRKRHAISRVEQLPSRIQITLGGWPYRKLRCRKSASLLTMMKPRSAAYFQTTGQEKTSVPGRGHAPIQDRYLSTWLPDQVPGSRRRGVSRGN
jgi:hypothetical protein